MRHFYMLLILSFLVGCSGKLPLGGTVTFSDDDSPVTRGSVIFSTPVFYAQGELKQDGSYVVGSDKLNDGIPKGEYAVHIVGAEKLEVVKNADGTTKENRSLMIDPKYTRAETSGLTFTVDGKTRRFDFQVDRIQK